MPYALIPKVSPLIMLILSKYVWIILKFVYNLIHWLLEDVVTISKV